jgi:hypothetical protein
MAHNYWWMNSVLGSTSKTKVKNTVGARKTHFNAFLSKQINRWISWSLQCDIIDTDLLCWFSVLKTNRKTLASIPKDAKRLMAINRPGVTVRSTETTLVRSWGNLSPGKNMGKYYNQKNMGKNWHLGIIHKNLPSFNLFCCGLLRPLLDIFWNCLKQLDRKNSF